MASIFDEDIRAALKEINADVAEALDLMGEDIRQTLHDHLKGDFYDQYSPSMYERRGYDGGMLGQVLDASTCSVTIKPLNSETHLAFEYYPIGNPVGETEADTPLGRTKVVTSFDKGNALIHSINDNRFRFDPGYDYDSSTGFWTLFVQEEIYEHGLEAQFCEAGARFGIEPGGTPMEYSSLDGVF